MKRMQVADLRNLFRAGKLARWQRALTVAVVCAGTAMMAQTPLASFNGTDGNEPNGLAQGTDGNFYGTTQLGGAKNLGAIFRITPSGRLGALLSFSGTDGSYPNAGLTLGLDGNFYGTTGSGGVNEGGTVFQFNPSTRKLTVLWNFPSGKGDGSEPQASLVLGADGNFYGTTALGGKYSSGMVFKITPSGTLTSLYSFCEEGYPCQATGMQPEASLVQLAGSPFYGTTREGGEHMSGTIFQITPTGTLTKVYDFENSPSSGLVSEGTHLYGTAGYGGAYGYGWIYEIGYLGGPPATIYSFCSQTGCPDGEDTAGQLLLGSDDNLYGTTYFGGSDNDGVAYEFNLSTNAFTTMHSFVGSDGLNPASGMIEATSGVLYGTTTGGGANGDGTVFSLRSSTLHGFIESVPIAGPVAANVIILGNNLTDATSVTFNGTDAIFRAVSNAEITATVPSGATTGKVKVVTSTGKTLTSNVEFWVTP